MGKKTRIMYHGMVEIEPARHLLINIKHLSKGTYVLKIIHQGKILVETTFIN